MFLETAIALFCLGFIVGVLATYLRAVRPLERELAEIRLEQRRELKRALYRAGAQQRHLGTPYIRTSLPLDSLGAFDLDDNDRWSRKARNFGVVS